MLKAVFLHRQAQLRLELPLHLVAAHVAPTLISGAGGGLVEKIHRLVREEVVGKVPAAQVHRRLQGSTADADSVVLLQTRPESLEHLQRRLPVGLLH